MNVMKCDRCGKIYMENNNRYDGRTIKGISTAVSGGSYVADKDLCDECYDQYELWITGHADFVERKSQIHFCKGECKNVNKDHHA